MAAGERDRRRITSRGDSSLPETTRSRPVGRRAAPPRTLELLESHTGRPLRPGGTLLFLDEIQAAPRVFTALRYFYETLPELHVIAAGSLLELVLELCPRAGWKPALPARYALWRSPLGTWGLSEGAGDLLRPLRPGSSENEHYVPDEMIAHSYRNLTAHSIKQH